MFRRRHHLPEGVEISPDHPLAMEMHIGDVVEGYHGVAVLRRGTTVLQLVLTLRDQYIIVMKQMLRR